MPFHRKNVLNFTEESSEVRSKDLYGAEIWALRKVDMPYLKSYEM